MTIIDTGSCIKSYLRNRCDYKLIHSCLGVVDLLFHEAWVHHIQDAVNGEGRLSNICSYNYLKSGEKLKYNEL